MEYNNGKETYTREMLNHDYSEEAYNYKQAGMTAEEIAADVKEILSEYNLEDEKIIDDYIENILSAI